MRIKKAILHNSYFLILVVAIIFAILIAVTMVMAKSFKSLKDPKLHLTDKLTFGKYKDCRIIDIMPDSWEYLMWLSKNTKVPFGQDVLDEITKHFKGYEGKRHKEEEKSATTSRFLRTFMYNGGSLIDNVLNSERNVKCLLSQ